MDRINVRVKGIHCNSCVMAIQDALCEAGAKDIHIQSDLKNRTGTIIMGGILDKKEIARIIKEQGDYEVE